MVQFSRMYVYRYCDLRKIHMHKHNALEVVYYEQGSGITNIGENTYSYEPNTFTVTPKETFMNEIHQTSTTPWCVMLDMNGFELKPGIYKDTKDRKIFRLIQKIWKENYNDSAVFRKEALDALCMLFVIEISRMLDENYEVKNRFAKVIREMEYNFLNEIDMQELAAITHYSYEHFRHLFKRFYGVSPKKYIQNCRLNYAKQMLKDERHYTATYISEICRFSNYNQFRILFKESTGLSPQAYRKQKLREEI